MTKSNTELQPVTTAPVPTATPSKGKTATPTREATAIAAIFHDAPQGDAAALVKRQDIMVSVATRALSASGSIAAGGSALVVAYAFLATRSNNQLRTLLADWASGNREGATVEAHDAATDNLRLWIGRVMVSAKVAVQGTTGKNAITFAKSGANVTKAAYTGWRNALTRSAALLAFVLSEHNTDPKAQEIGIATTKSDPVPRIMGPAVLTDEKATGRVTYDGTSDRTNVEAVNREAKKLLGWPEERRQRDGGNGNARVVRETGAFEAALSIVTHYARMGAPDGEINAFAAWPEHVRDFASAIGRYMIDAGGPVVSKDEAYEPDLKLRKAA